MEPIISPLWFYLIDTITSLKDVFVVFGIIFIGVLIFSSLIHSYNFDDCIDFWKSKGKRGLIFSFFIIIIGLLIPSNETAYKMLVASMITPDNIAAVGGTAQDIVDYIINSVNELLNQ